MPKAIGIISKELPSGDLVEVIRTIEKESVADCYDLIASHENCGYFVGLFARHDDASRFVISFDHDTHENINGWKIERQYKNQDLRDVLGGE